MHLFKNGDRCPCCGTVIEGKTVEELQSFSLMVSLMGINPKYELNYIKPLSRRPLDLPQAWLAKARPPAEEVERLLRIEIDSAAESIVQKIEAGPIAAPLSEYRAALDELPADVRVSLDQQFDLFLGRFSAVATDAVRYFIAGLDLAKPEKEVPHD